MSAIELMSLGSKISKLSLQSTPEEFAPLLEKIGITDLGMVEKVLSVARLASSDPTESLGAFMKNGGLMRMLAGTPAQEGDQDDEVVLKCPHCEEFIIYS
jgi:hypothetical protein